MLLRYFYYLFTTMTTIGFGDYNPKGNGERLTIAMMMLFGVMLMTFIMGELISLLQRFEAYLGEFEQYEKLAQFFDTLIM